MLTIWKGLRYFGQESQWGCAILYVVFPSESMGVVQRWLMLRTPVCEFSPNPFYSGMTLTSGYRFVKILVIEIFSSVLGLFGLIIGLLVSSNANDFA